MDTRSNLVSQLYSSAQVAVKPVPQAREAPSNAGAADFAALMGEFAQSLRAGEQTIKSGLTGKADAHSVVEALASMELAVQTAVTVRDKVVEAYQEILRMPV